MKKVLLRGPLLSISGYGIHSRQLFAWLEKRKDVELSVDILKWGMTPWMINSELEDGLVGRIMSKSKEVRKDKYYDITFQVQLPDEWDTSLGKNNVGVSAFVETDKCNPKWLEFCEKMDHIIVPSKFTKEVIENTGKVDRDITVIPEWYNEKIDDYSKNTKKMHFSPKFNFLAVSTITAKDQTGDRKNLFNTIKWFCEEFKDDKKVGLVLKTSLGKGSNIDRQMTKQFVSDILSVTRQKSKFPKVSIIHGNMTNEEVSWLYKQEKVKCIISATRGEGYGLPLIEAAASKVPVIATNWSGHLDFLGDKFVPLDYELIDIPRNKVDGRIFVEGTKWAEVKESDFKKKIRDVYNNYSNYLGMSESLQKEVKSKFSRDKVTKMYDDFLNKII